MAGTGKTGGTEAGQRSNLSSGSGRKKRSPTSTSRKGSRVDPSHQIELKREQRAKKAAKAPTLKKAKKEKR